MQISQINNSNPNFQALRKIQIKGDGFKKHPDYATNILNEIKINKPIMKFFERWDSKIVLSATKDKTHKRTIDLTISYRKLPEKTNKLVGLISKIFTPYRKVSFNNLGYHYDEAANSFIDKDINNGIIEGYLDYINKTADKKNVGELIAEKPLKTKRETNQEKLTALISEMTKED